MGKPRILIVDDEERIRDALSRWFELRGFDVQVAEDGVEAVQKCMDSVFDVVTIDLEMPRMNGAEAIAQIKGRVPAMPILVLTGFSRSAPEAMSCGAAKILTKPIQLRELEKEVRLLIGRAVA